MGKQKNCLLTFRIPATEDGYDLVKQMKKTLNKDSYKMRTLFTGKRPNNHTAFTLKKDAESIRVYIESIIEGNVSSEVEHQIYESGIGTGKAREQLANEERFNKAIEYTKKLLDKIVAKENELKLEITGHNMVRKERDALKKQYLALDENSKKDMELRQREIDRLNARIEEIEHINCGSIDTCNCICKMCEQVEGTLIKEKACLETKVEGMRREIVALNTKVDNEVCEGSCVSHEDYDEALELKASMREEIIALNNSLSTAHEDIIKYKKLLEEEIIKNDALRDCHSKLEESAYAKKSEDFTDMAFDEWMKKQSWYSRLVYKIGSIAWRDMAMMLFAFWTISTIIVLILRVEGVWVY